MKSGILGSYSTHKINDFLDGINPSFGKILKEWSSNASSLYSSRLKIVSTSETFIIEIS